MAGFSDWQAEATPDEIVVRVCLNRRVYREWQEASEALEAYRPSDDAEDEQTTLDGPDDDVLRAMMQRVMDATERLREAQRPFVFRQLPWAQFRKLADDHPPTDEQVAENDLVDTNGTTFWPELMAACCVDPGMTVEQAAWLRDGDDDWPGLPPERWEELVGAVQQVNVAGSDLPKSVLSTVEMLRPVLRSTTPQPTESLSPSSVDG